MSENRVIPIAELPAWGVVGANLVMDLLEVTTPEQVEAIAKLEEEEALDFMAAALILQTVEGEALSLAKGLVQTVYIKEQGLEPWRAWMAWAGAYRAQAGPEFTQQIMEHREQINRSLGLQGKV